MAFIHAEPNQLDSTYSGPLQESAWRFGDQSELSAIRYLLQTHIQNELRVIGENIEGTTLDVERKHNIEKRGEARRVSSVAKCSRDGVLLSWRKHACLRQHFSTHRAEERAKRKAKHLNITSMAMRKNPDVFPRGQGKLWWEKEGKSRTRTSNAQSSSAAFREYVTEHKEEPQQEVLNEKARLLAPFKDCSQTLCSWPATVGAWLKWLENADNKAMLQKAKQAVKGGCRRKHNHRLEELPPQLSRSDLKPHVEGKRVGSAMPSWSDRLVDGFYVAISRGSAWEDAHNDFQEGIPPKKRYHTRYLKAVFLSAIFQVALAYRLT